LLARASPKVRAGGDELDLLLAAGRRISDKSMCSLAIASSVPHHPACPLATRLGDRGNVRNGQHHTALLPRRCLRVVFRAAHGIFDSWVAGASGSREGQRKDKVGVTRPSTAFRPRLHQTSLASTRRATQRCWSESGRNATAPFPTLGRQPQSAIAPRDSCRGPKRTSRRPESPRRRRDSDVPAGRGAAIRTVNSRGPRIRGP
jgi:hypothetical protein